MPKAPGIQPQADLRALTPFKNLPPGHKTFEVTRDGAEPHLNVGEFAVIDTSDRDVQNGELYLIQWTQLREIVVVRRRTENLILPGHTMAEPTLCWYAGDLRGYRPLGKVTGQGSPVFVGTVDGPYLTDHIEEKLMGRVVGFAPTSLGGLLDQHVSRVEGQHHG